MAETRNTIGDLTLAVVLVFVAFGGFAFINPTDAAIHPGAGGMSWRTMPFIYSALIGVLALLMGASALLDYLRIQRGQRPRALLGQLPESAPACSLLIFRRVATIMALLGYATLIQSFGFSIATVFLLFGMQFIFGRTRLLPNAIVSFIGSLLLWAFFGGFLKLPLRGDLWDPVSPILEGAFKAIGM